MDRLKTFLFLLLFLLIETASFCETGKPGLFTFDWINQELEVTGTGHIIPGKSGNLFQWQYDAVLRAQADLIKNFILSMNILRLDAYHSASDLIKLEPGINESIYNYVYNIKKHTVKYTDDGVILRSTVPLFGVDGLAGLLVTAGSDTGNFYEYSDYVYSIDFTGVVIDARGLGRVPALAPRIFDENHRLVFSAVHVSRESYEKWGAVQYTDDPYYRGFEGRVGENPFRIVAMANDNLIQTDIALSTDDAKVILQNEMTKQYISEGRVIIIIEAVSQPHIRLSHTYR
jgi:hypothetical protein